MSARFDPRAWTTVAALLAFGTLTLSAQERPAAGKKEEKRSVPAAGGVKAYIDPATGKLREPTPEDLRNEAAAAGPQFQETTSPEILFHPGGAVSVVLGPEHMSYSVVKKNDDGTISTICVQGGAKAEAWMKDTLSKEKLDVK